MGSSIESKIGQSAHELSAAIKAHARALGFDLVGITHLGPVATAPAFREWLESGYAGEMGYLERGADKRADTHLPYDGVTSAIVVAMNYGGRKPPGPFARYARGDDYHDVMLAKLHALHAWINETIGYDVHGKPYVDTGPILERDLARRAGLGWFGKNSNLINPKLGSFFFLGSLLLDLGLPEDDPFEMDRCGSCTRCLDACPTDAFVAPRTLDATRCISYLTIELRGSIPEPFRAPMGELVYGCDICQEVCPWNVRFAEDVTEPALASREGMDDPDLRQLLTQSDTDFRERFRKSAVKRTKRHGLARNVAIALGNKKDPDNIPALRHTAVHDPDLAVRESARWAIANIRGTGEHIPRLTSET